MITAQTYGDGRWFPAEGDTLRHDIESYINDVPPVEFNGKVVSALAPHAGYRYSGPVAAHTFSALASCYRGQAPLVVILGFTHQERFEGLALLEGSRIRTPLGESALDEDAGRQLAEYSRHIFFNSRPHQGEWSAENEIPFTQVALPDSPMVVGLLGHSTAPLVEETVNALVALNRSRNLIVIASTDMTHDPDYELVSQTDRRTLEQVSAMDLDGLRRSWAPDAQNFCGIGPVSIAMAYAKRQGCSSGRVLHYRNSGDDFPESRGQWVVGYSSVVFTA